MKKAEANKVSELRAEYDFRGGTRAPFRLLLLFIISVLSGCDLHPDDECRLDADCPAGKHCVDSCRYLYCDDTLHPDDCHQVCRTDPGPCHLNSDCPDGRCQYSASPFCGFCDRCGCLFRETNRSCPEPWDAGDCKCYSDSDCAAGQHCQDRSRCALDGAEADCGDGRDDEGDGLTDCEDLADCEGHRCMLHASSLGMEDGRCEGGVCTHCGVESCEADADCAACGAYRMCDPAGACCTACPIPWCACL